MGAELQSQNHVDVDYKKLLVLDLAYKNTLEDQYFIDSEPKGEVISSKIDWLTAIYASKFKRAWQAQFLSHNLQILEINLSFEAGKMILVYHLPNQNPF